ncbi:MAG: thioredoxin domain-containing protein, partial [bacterium]|nr:thioredoxin domain-containing protein [Candidatus Kapabacteria bacterium]
WCHVMERESFEDEATAALMNELCINIKVDREERPDVDQVYMTAVQVTQRNGGWPLSAWLTQDLKPFYLGTYFPPRPAFGRPSFTDALRQLNEAWTNDREKVIRAADAIARAVGDATNVVEDPDRKAIDAAVVDNCYAQLARSYDEQLGGFGAAPKFPRPSIFEFLLRYNALRNDARALEMTTNTLRLMSNGGMYDQLGGGFARYSVDAEWRVPHFEKMLYDQGQLVSSLADAYRITGDEFFAKVIRHTVEYLERDLMVNTPGTAGFGTFYSAEDADSEGEEGTFYVWTIAELTDALDADELAAVTQYYGISEAGNFEHGKNVLHTSSTIDDVARSMSLSGDDVERLLASARAKLFAIRAQRVRPSRDEKVLTSWNGLMIGGLARAASALGENRFANLAATCARWLLENMRDASGRLMHRMKDGDVKIPSFVDDHAFLAQGLIDLYETTFDESFLEAADALVREANDLFWDEEGGGYYMTAGDDPSVLFRSKADHDGAEPSGNSVMAMILLRLGRLFYDADYLAKAERTIRMFTARVEDYPSAMPLMVAAAMINERPPRQIVIATTATDSDGALRLRDQAVQAYRPDAAIVVVAPDGPGEWLSKRMEMIGEMRPVNDMSVAYVCENLACQAPVTTLQ